MRSATSRNSTVQSNEESSNLISSRQYNSTNNGTSEHNFKLHQLSPSKSLFFRSSNKYWCIWATIITIVLCIILTTIIINSNNNNDNNSLFSLHNESKKSKSNEIDQSVCTDPKYLKKTLDLAYESKIAGLILDHKGASKYEASGIQYDNKNGVFYVVFDSLYAIGRIDYFLHRSPVNILIADEKKGVIGESGYEGIFIDMDSESLYVITEAVVSRHTDQQYRAIVHKITIKTLDENNKGASAYYSREHACKVNYNFRDGNKGLESLAVVKNSTGSKFLIGLCEGNYCLGGDEGKERGNGRIIIIRDVPISFESADLDGYTCEYQYIKEVKLPTSAYFKDYSAINFRKIEGDDYNVKVVVVSQEDSSVWIGIFNIDRFEFSKDGQIYQFPRGSGCEVEYCNVEGVTWYDDYTLLATSDKTKSEGRQNFYCQKKDQSIHIFSIPK